MLASHLIMAGDFCRAREVLDGVPRGGLRPMTAIERLKVETMVDGPWVPAPGLDARLRELLRQAPHDDPARPMAEVFLLLVLRKSGGPWREYLASLDQRLSSSGLRLSRLVLDYYRVSVDGDLAAARRVVDTAGPLGLATMEERAAFKVELRAGHGDFHEGAERFDRLARAAARRGDIELAANGFVMAALCLYYADRLDDALARMREGLSLLTRDAGGSAEAWLLRTAAGEPAGPRPAPVSGFGLGPNLWTSAAHQEALDLLMAAEQAAGALGRDPRAPELLRDLARRAAEHRGDAWHDRGLRARLARLAPQ